jgi:hypothetical protein
VKRYIKDYFTELGYSIKAFFETSSNVTINFITRSLNTEYINFNDSSDYKYFEIYNIRDELVKKIDKEDELIKYVMDFNKTYNTLVRNNRLDWIARYKLNDYALEVFAGDTIINNTGGHTDESV